jgi:hypothetical protein
MPLNELAAHRPPVRAYHERKLNPWLPMASAFRRATEGSARAKASRWPYPPHYGDKKRRLTAFAFSDILYPLRHPLPLRSGYHSPAECGAHRAYARMLFIRVDCRGDALRLGPTFRSTPSTILLVAHSRVGLMQCWAALTNARPPPSCQGDMRQTTMWSRLPPSHRCSESA